MTYKQPKKIEALRTLRIANKIARRHHGPEECDYNVQDQEHKHNDGSNDKWLNGDKN